MRWQLLHRFRLPIFIVVLLLLTQGTFILGDIFSMDEADGLAIWFVYDAVQPAEGIRATLLYVIDSTARTIQRAAAAGDQPPLSYLMLDAWILGFGESESALQIYGVFWGMLLLAALFRLAHGGRGGTLAIILLGISPLMFHITLSHTPLGQFLVFSLIAALLYLRWRERINWLQTLIYSVILVALTLTAFAGLLVVVAGGIHYFVPRRSELLNLKRVLPYLLGIGAAVGWGILAQPSSLITSSWIFFLLAILALTIIEILFQKKRYELEFLLIAAVFIIAQIMVIQWFITRPPYKQAVLDVADQRSPLEPLIFDIPPQSIIAYYARQLELNQGYTLNVGWRDFDEREMIDMMDKLQDASAVWLFYPVGSSGAEFTLIHLMNRHDPDYARVVEDFLIFRFNLSGE